MKKLFVAALLLSATVAFAKNPTQESKITIKDSDARGVPTFITGELGSLGSGAKDFMRANRGLLGGTGSEDF
ncbi:MAG TPA: hypothetical protein VHK90_06505, partial [Thermoanaerobaculia bacterium]|nr:hypothetical protein [Thermoanaerobaculia bacterium]